MRAIRAELLKKEQELRMLELKVRQERDTGDVVDKINPQRMVDALKELAEKNKEVEVRPEPTVSSATPLKNLLATDFQRKILSELDARRNKVRWIARCRSSRAKLDFVDIALSQVLDYSGYVAKRDKDSMVEEAAGGAAVRLEY